MRPHYIRSVYSKCFVIDVLLYNDGDFCSWCHYASGHDSFQTGALYEVAQHKSHE